MVSGGHGVSIGRPLDVYTQGALRKSPSDPHAYFAEQLLDNDEFFARFGAEPDWKGRSVLDFGCGHGALGVRAAERGARRVVGVDLNAGLIAFARDNIGDRYPHLSGRISFVCDDIAAVSDRFDLILSKDTFEHVRDVAGTLELLADRLADAGELWIGFSPLYYGPFGGHGRTGTSLPWAHVLPWAYVRRRAARFQGRAVETLADLELNGVSPAAFRNLAAEAGLTITVNRYNRGDKWLLRPLNVLRAVPGIERYATVSVYAILVHG